MVSLADQYRQLALPHGPLCGFMVPPFGFCVQLHRGQIDGSRLLQHLQRVADIGIEPTAAGIEIRKDRLAHPRVPEFLDVVGNAGNGLVVALALKEFSDLIGHVDQPIRRHG